MQLAGLSAAVATVKEGERLLGGVDLDQVVGSTRQLPATTA